MAGALVPAIDRWNAVALAATLRWPLRQPKSIDILWFYEPWASHLKGKLGESVVCYHVHDEVSEFTFNRHIARVLWDQELRALGQADLIFCSSEEQYRRRQPQFPEKTHLALNGVDFELYSSVWRDPSLPIPEDVRDLPRPIFGFYGELGLTFDPDLLLGVAQSWPEASFVLLGPDNLDRQYGGTPVLKGLRRQPNIHFRRQRPVSELPAYLKSFDAIFLPYRTDGHARYSQPLKMYEGLAAGKPIVATPLLAIQRHESLVYVAATSDECVRRLQEALQHPTDRRDKGIALARENDWEHRVAQIAQLVADLLAKRRVAAQDRR
ncbi:MAG: glycosyltransferase [Chloroflexi bacterium]|nr:glycosyltransferase [Chloroflexota bacterium]